MKEQKGITIVGFTKEQVETYRLVKFEKTNLSLEIDNSFHPNEYSIEEAVVISTHADQKLYKVGDNVLIDFVVFTSGKHSQFEGGSQSRYVGSDDVYDHYWLTDPLHPMDVSEVYAVISDKGQVQPIGDVVIIDRKEKEEYIQKGDLYIPSGLLTNKPFMAKVLSAPPDSIVKPGEDILCEAGYSPVIKFRSIEVEYINYPYIIGKIVDNQLQLL